MADKTVVVFERDEKFVKALKLYFRGSSYDPATYTDSAEAITAAGDANVGAVMVSLESADDEGKQILSDMSAKANAPIIVMSTKKEETEFFADGVRSLGGAAYIKKPFIKKAILKLLDQVVSGEITAPTLEKKEGVDMKGVFTDMDAVVDDLFEGDEPAGDSGGGDEFTISFENDAAAETSDDDSVQISLDDDPDTSPMEAEVETSTETSGAFSPSASQSGTEPATGEFKRLRERVRELETELKQKSDDFKSVSREKERVENSVGKKESELIEKLRSAEKQVEDLEEDVKKRKQLVAQLTASVSQLNEDIEEKDGKHGKDHEEMQTHVGTLQKESDDNLELAKQRGHEIEDKSEEIERRGRQIEDLEAERNELQASLQTMTENRDDLDSQLNTERSRIASGEEKFKAGIGSLISSLEGDMDKRRQALENVFSQATQAIEQSLTQAKESVDEQLRNAREGFDQEMTQVTDTVERSSASANDTLSQGSAALKGE